MAVNTSVKPLSPAEQEAQAIVQGLLQRARAAQRIAEQYDQARVDELVAAAAWAILEPGRNQALLRLHQTHQLVHLHFSRTRQTCITFT